MSNASISSYPYLSNPTGEAMLMHLLRMILYGAVALVVVIIVLFWLYHEYAVKPRNEWIRFQRKWAKLPLYMRTEAWDHLKRARDLRPRVKEAARTGAVGESNRKYLEEAIAGLEQGQSQSAVVGHMHMVRSLETFMQNPKAYVRAHRATMTVGAPGMNGTQVPGQRRSETTIPPTAPAPPTRPSTPCVPEQRPRPDNRTKRPDPEREV